MNPNVNAARLEAVVRAKQAHEVTLSTWAYANREMDNARTLLRNEVNQLGRRLFRESDPAGKTLLLKSSAGQLFYLRATGDEREPFEFTEATITPFL